MTASSAVDGFGQAKRYGPSDDPPITHLACIVATVAVCAPLSTRSHQRTGAE